MVGYPVFTKGIGWSIGNGEKIRVWQDSWIKGVPLRELIEGPLTRNEYDLKVTNLKQNQVWNWELISFDLPQAIKDKIKAVPFQLYGTREDTIIWKAAKDGDFSTRSAYQLAIPSDNPGALFRGSWIWKMDMLPKIINFLWLCYHNNVPVRDVLANRGISNNNACLVCGR